MNGLALCAGVGGLELGLRIALGERYRCVGYVEREAFAAATLMARMEDEALDRAPIWDDLATFDGHPLRGCVDLISSGLPCQPYSLAGKRGGHSDSRALWPEFVRIVRECQPAIVFLENVPPFLKHFEPVWAELRSMGFDVASPAVYSAAECGAPHIRRRLFILAWNSYCLSEGAIPGEGGGPSPEPTGVGELASDPHSGGQQGVRRGWLLDRQRETLRPNADRCGDGSRNDGAPWASESPVLRMDDGPPYRVDRLRAIGNGVVPIVAARAFLTLARQAGLELELEKE